MNIQVGPLVVMSWCDAGAWPRDIGVTIRLGALTIRGGRWIGHMSSDRARGRTPGWRCYLDWRPA